MSDDALRDGFLAALRAGRRTEAFAAADRARAAGLGMGEVYLRVIQPSMHEIGSLWQQNRITVADEHLATAITQAVMARLYQEMLRAPAEPGPLLIAACADQERHELGLRMICDLLEMDGWETVFLGASVPVEDLVAMVAARRPDAVALSAAIAPHLPRVRDAIAGIRGALGSGAPVIAAGGRAFARDPELAARLGADLTAEDAPRAAALLKETMAA